MKVKDFISIAITWLRDEIAGMIGSHGDLADLPDHYRSGEVAETSADVSSQILNLLDESCPSFHRSIPGKFCAVKIPSVKSIV